jgi:phosphatidylserine/phosphatidylglycerophosphate/cardiolipin synthase-like enzyme
MNKTFIVRLNFLICIVITLSSCAKPTVNVCFTPGGNCTRAITYEIEQAKTEILVQAYSLTAKPVADAVAKAKETGVTVEIILDLSDDFARNSAVYFRSLKGIPIYLDAQHAIADNNIIIIDRATVVTGSFKFMNKAEGKNASNLLIIKSDTLAAAYVDNWNQHKKHSVEYKQAGQYKEAKKAPGKKKRPQIRQ